jgi:hypothetical protein
MVTWSRLQKGEEEKREDGENFIKGNLSFVFIIAHGAPIKRDKRGHLRTKTSKGNVYRIL